MSFKSYNGVLRRLGRQMVLPVNKIKYILEKEIFEQVKIDVCVDFGSGTLFWSEWLKHKVLEIYAVDIIYDMRGGYLNGIKCINNIDELKFNPSNKKMFFLMDVLHHLDQGFENELMQKINKNFDYVIIKDINCHNVFGNFMNHIHDKIINGENIKDTDPYALVGKLSDKGYDCKIFWIRKLWYPHFLIIAKR